jgi:thiosulfate/3-mercaptopyruvate sulfurtransferase
MARSDVLVSADWAEQNLNTPKTVFVEVDEDTSAYDGGHIEGAVKLDWRKDLQDGVRRDFLNQEQFSDLLSAKGIANDDTVVLYGGNNNWFAAYAYWYFKLYGHQDIKLIDGGRKKWELDGRPLSKDAVNREATQYKAETPDFSIRAFRDEVIDAIGSKNLVDVRSPDEFSGKILAPAHLPQEQAQQRGHGPGAINIPWSTTATEDGTFKSDDDLAKLYGHQDIKLIDGGRKKWELDGRELSKDEVTRPATQYKAEAPDFSIRAFRDEVISSIGSVNLVDVRSPDEFSGKILAPAHLPQEQAQQRGHVPTAINIPWSTTANEDGTFKSDDDLAKLYADKGFDDTKNTIAYCRIGERSSHTWFVLQEILGKSNVKNYDGSWVEYGSLVGAPIELGA